MQERFSEIFHDTYIIIQFECIKQKMNIMNSIFINNKKSNKYNFIS